MQSKSKAALRQYPADSQGGNLVHNQSMMHTINSIKDLGSAPPGRQSASSFRANENQKKSHSSKAVNHHKYQSNRKNTNQSVNNLELPESHA